MSHNDPKPLKIAPTAQELIAQQRHIDWLIAQEQGRNRNGRDYLGHRVHGRSKTKKGRSRNACRGKVRDY